MSCLHRQIGKSMISPTQDICVAMKEVDGCKGCNAGTSSSASCRWVEHLLLFATVSCVWMLSFWHGRHAAVAASGRGPLEYGPPSQEFCSA